MNYSRKQVIEYLKQAIQLEAALYQQRRYNDYLNDTLRKLKNPSLDSRERFSPDYDFGPVTKFVMFYLVVSIIVSLIKIWEDGVFGLILLVPSVLVLVGIIGHKIYCNKKRENEVINHNREADAYNESLIKKNKGQILNVEKAQNILQVKIRETQKTLNELYSYNIIYDKYRNLPAECSLVEYLESGRCESLTGHEGGYNIYEHELRLNMVIGKLDVVIDRLDEISSNQRTLFVQLQDSNRRLSAIKQGTEQILQSTGAIEDNSSVAAFNSSITAMNSACQTWMMSSWLKKHY